MRLAGLLALLIVAISGASAAGSNAARSEIAMPDISAQ